MAHLIASTASCDGGQLAASTYPNRERFLTELTLDPPTASSDEAGVPLLDEDYLILSTIHSAKGREWNSVFVLNCVDGCIPSDKATESTLEVEEERRLLYVASFLAPRAMPRAVCRLDFSDRACRVMVGASRSGSAGHWTSAASSDGTVSGSKADGSGTGSVL